MRNLFSFADPFVLKYFFEKPEDKQRYIIQLKLKDIFKRHSVDLGSNLCGFDATASGFQIIGGLLLDKEMMKYTNVLPNEEKEDMYKLFGKINLENDDSFKLLYDSFLAEASDFSIKL